MQSLGGDNQSIVFSKEDSCKVFVDFGHPVTLPYKALSGSHATPSVKPGEAIPVYTPEELEAMDKEEQENPDAVNPDESENADEEVDYSDFDKYYDDDKK